MIKYLAIPLILVGCTAPVTDPPAHACSPRLDGKPTYCPDEKDLILVKEEPKGEIDITVHIISEFADDVSKKYEKGQIEKMLPCLLML